MSNYDWGKHYEERNADRTRNEVLRQQRKFQGGTIDDFPKSKKEYKKQEKQMAKDYNQKIISVHNEMSTDEMNEAIEIWENTKHLERQKRTRHRAKDLFPFYKKYVDRKARLSGCGGCIKAQQRFFEMLIDYHKNGQETK